MKPVDTASFCLEISPVDLRPHQVPFLFSTLTAGSSINKAATFPSASKVIFLTVFKPSSNFPGDLFVGLLEALLGGILHLLKTLAVSIH